MYDARCSLAYVTKNGSPCCPGLFFSTPWDIMRRFFYRQIFALSCLAIPPVVFAEEAPGEASQKTAFEKRFTCGRNALYVLAALMGRTLSPNDLTACMSETPAATGVNLLELKQAADTLGLPCVIRQTSFEDLSTITLPVIAHLDGSTTTGSSGHFVVVVDVDVKKGKVFLVDGTTAEFGGKSIRAFRDRWSGYILQPETAFRLSLDQPLVAGALAFLAVSALIVFRVYRKNLMRVSRGTSVEA